MDKSGLGRELENEARRIRYALDDEHRAKRRAHTDKWKAENREEYLKQQADKRREQYATPDGKARLDSNTERYNKRNPGKKKEFQDSWYAKNGAKYHREWAAKNREKHPEVYVWRNARNRAKEKGLEFSITLDDIVIPEFCPVLGIKLEKGNGPFKDASPSLDRLDNVKGYVKGNIAVISWRANRLKSDATIEEIEKLIAFMERK
jgi:hypothetical protein